MKSLHIHVLVLVTAILGILVLPDLVGDRANQLIMGWIAGWQIGGWCYQIGEWIVEKYNV
jgi:hypothetical protein